MTVQDIFEPTWPSSNIKHRVVARAQLKTIIPFQFPLFKPSIVGRFKTNPLSSKLLRGMERSGDSLLREALVSDEYCNIPNYSTACCESFLVTKVSTSGTHDMSCKKQLDNTQSDARTIVKEESVRGVTGGEMPHLVYTDGPRHLVWCATAVAVVKSSLDRDQTQSEHDEYSSIQVSQAARGRITIPIC